MCWWEEATWPLKSQDEITSEYFEDIRERIFLLRHPDAGGVDLLWRYGKYIEDEVYVPYDRLNWSGSWAVYEPPAVAHPGDVIVLFKDDSGEIDLYINCVEMFEQTLDNNMPIKSDGKLNSQYWRLAPNPNKYHHWDHNAGKPVIDAEGRWIIRHFGAMPSCGLLAYNNILNAFSWLPQQVAPLLQIPPLKFISSGQIKNRHQSVEFAKNHITQNIGSQDARSRDESGYEPCKKPRRDTEYVLYNGEPEGSDQSYQYAADPKLTQAYQDHVEYCAEHQYPMTFLKKVDDQFVIDWEYAETDGQWQPNGYYTRGTIVYKNDANDLGDPRWVCTQNHTDSGGDKEPGTAGGEDYWMTPAYQPEYFREHPVYVPFSHEYWRCNCSALELMLRELSEDSEDYDWYWDTSYPAVPLWLYTNWKVGDNFYPNGTDDWPKPRGCWRRTWRHSMGRVGSMMWPGEKGDPPGYEPRHFIVDQATYNQIPADNKKYYKVVDVENLYTEAYTDAHEALIAERHDPVQIRKLKYYDQDADENKIKEHPLYEIHHDLINDLRNVLLQMYLVDDSPVDIWFREKHYYSGKCQECSSLERSTSLQAYAAGRASVESICEDNPLYGNYHELPFTEEDFDHIGYRMGISGSPGDPGSYCTMCNYDYTGKHLFEIELDIPVGFAAVYHITNGLFRVAWKGIQMYSEDDHKDGCEIGFLDLTIYADPIPPGGEEIVKNAYIRLPFINDYYWFNGIEWRHSFVYKAVLISPWPHTEAGGFFDFVVEDDPLLYNWYRETLVDTKGYSMNAFCVVEIDWDKVPESVFELDDTNVIEIES